MRSQSVTSFLLLTVTAAIISLLGCSNPQPGPDKTITGALLGAGWGAGAGAVVGNQVSSIHNPEGSGAAIGAGFGLVQGALEGAGFDLNESELLDQRKDLESIRIANNINRQRLHNIQSRLEHPPLSGLVGGVYQVFFDSDATNLRAGAIANLETIADSLLGSPHAVTIYVVGHSDDSGQPQYNSRLAEARARSVTGYLAARGISLDQIRLSSHGSSRPIATNSTEVGRQLNRRVDVYISAERGT